MKAGGGAIVNTASIAALEAGAAPIAYSAAKAGVLHLSRVAAAELARYKIRVNAICPGFIMTEIFSSSFGLSDNAATQANADLRAISPYAQPLAILGKRRPRCASMPLSRQRRRRLRHRNASRGRWRRHHRAAQFLGSCFAFAYLPASRESFGGYCGEVKEGSSFLKKKNQKTFAMWDRDRGRRPA